MEEHEILFVTSDKKKRTNFEKPLRSAGFKVSFVSSLEDMQQIMKGMVPKILIQDWTTLDKILAQRSQMSLSKVDSYADMYRVILVHRVTPEILALAHDAALSRVFLAGLPPRGLAGQISLIMSAESTLSPFQKTIHKLRTNAESYDQAEIDETIESTYKQFPHDDVVKVEYGGLCLRKKNFEDGLKVAEELIVKDENNVRAMNLKSRCLMKMGEFDAAIETLQQADGLSPLNPERLAYLGESYYNKGEVSIAKKYFEKARNLNPREKAANVGLGKILLEEGEAESALDFFTSTVSEDEAASFFNNAGVAAMKKDRVTEAMRLYNTALKSLKSTKLKHRIMFNYALAQKTLEDYQGAERTLKQVLTLDSNFEKAQRQLEIVRSLSQRKKSA